MTDTTSPARRLALVAGTLLVASTVQAQEWPSRTVRAVVPFTAGGGTDITARLIARQLTGKWGHSVVIDNRGGAGGTVGAEIVAKAPADGYTLLITSASLAVAATLYPKLSFSPTKAFVPVTQLVSVPLVLVVHPSVPARSVKELVELSRKRPGGVNFGSNGSGTTSHLSGGLLNQIAGIQLTHVPYKGAAPAITALLTGEVDMGFIAALTVRPLLQAGKLRPLAVTTRKAAEMLPGVPTLDATFKGFETDNWYALFVAAGTPQPIVDKLHADTVAALAHPDVTGNIRKQAAEPVGNAQAEFAAFFRQEVDKYAKIIRSVGAKVD